MKKLLIISLLWAGFPVWGSAQDLAAYQRIAEDQNPGLKAHYAAFEAALQQLPQVSSLPDPMLSMSAFGRMTETRTGPQQARFSLMQTFPWFGTLAAKKDAAALAAEAKYMAYLDARNALRYQVRAAYYPLYELEQMIAHHHATIDILASLKQLATVRFQNGKGDMTDVIRTELMTNDFRAEVNIMHEKRRVLAATFNQLLGRDSGAEVRVEDSLEFADTPYTQLADTALAGTPRLLEYDKLTAAAHSQEIAARKSGMPMLGLGLDYIAVGKRTDALPIDNGQDVIMPMLTVSLPIFRKKYVAAQQEARFMQSSYAARKQETENGLRTEWEAAQFERSQAVQLVRLYEAQVMQTQQLMDLMQVAYANNETAFEEILRTQQQLLNYQIAREGALTDFFTAQSKLEYLTAQAE